MLRRSQRSVQMQFSNVNVAAVLISYMHQSGVEQTENMSDASLFFNVSSFISCTAAASANVLDLVLIRPCQH